MYYVVQSNIHTINNAFDNQMQVSTNFIQIDHMSLNKKSRQDMPVIYICVNLHAMFIPS